RSGEIARPERLAHGEAVLAREEPVEHDHVVLVHGGLLLARLARLGDVDDESLLLEALGEELRRLTVVLDQKNAHRTYRSEAGNLRRDMKKNSGVLGDSSRWAPADL